MLQDQVVLGLFFDFGHAHQWRAGGLVGVQQLTVGLSSHLVAGRRPAWVSWGSFLSRSATTKGEVFSLRRGLDAFGFLAAVVGFNGQLGIGPSLERAGLFLPGVGGHLLAQLFSCLAFPCLDVRVTPLARVATGGGVV